MTGLNRAQRRALKASMRRSGREVVTLVGGPMTGWIVKPDAPALRPEWRDLYLEAAAESAYRKAVAEDNQGLPLHERRPALRWDRVPEKVKAEIRVLVRSQLGAGHYELRREGLEAEWVVDP